MSCRFIFVRHGQSEGNLKGLLLGTTDLPLTEVGVRQAERAADYLKDTPIDVVYSSPLLRAYGTAERIADLKDMSIISDSAYSEIYAGVWEGMKFSDITEKYSKELHEWKENIGTSTCPGGESFADIYRRVIEETERLAALYDGQTVCVTTHTTPIRAVWAKSNGLRPEEVKSPPGVPNASVTIVDVGSDGFVMRAYGIAEHLGDMVTCLPNTV